MPTTNTPPILPGCSTLPPMESPSGSGRRHQDHPKAEDKAKGKASRRKTADRFAVLNAFVDFTLAGLTRNETAVWLVLYRDTRNGAARTGQTDISRRAGISARSVRRGIDGLRKRGLVKRVYQGGVGRGTSVYRVRPLPPERHGT